MRGLFVTGTDTGVGKTLVAASLASALRERGFRVGVMKPVESGCSRVQGRLVPTDARRLVQASGCTSSPEDVCPYALEAALAPALAAEQEGIEIDPAHIAGCLARIASIHDVVIVEGAGGLLTPFAGPRTMRDLAALLVLPAIVVVRNVLGAINHAALTVEAAKGAGIEVAGLVLNDLGPHSDDAAMTNAASLERWGAAPLIGHVPYIPAGDADAAVAAGHRLVAGLGGWRVAPVGNRRVGTADERR